MSDLQIALLAIGIAVIAVVVAYNKWQEMQLRRRADRAFASGHLDALLAEPALVVPGGKERTQAQDRRAGPTERVEHTLGAGGLEGVPASPHPPPAGLLEPAVDYVVELNCAHRLDGPVLGRCMATLASESLAKPIYWEGCDTATSGWRPLVPEGQYERVRVGMQLINRAGPASEQDLRGFCAALRKAAPLVGAAAVFPDVTTAAGQAAELDRFCTEVDVQIGLSIVGSDAHAFAGDHIWAVAETAGLVMDRDGRCRARAEDGTELFALVNLEATPFHAGTIRTLQTRGVAVLYDVPRVPASLAPFHRFIEFAHDLEQTLGGVLVDDNKRPIGQVALETIMQQLDYIHRTMAARNIPAGGPLALRLFS